MRSPISEYLNNVLDDVRNQDSGNVADYIQALAEANPDYFGIAITTVDGQTYSAGDDEVEFSIQSISKPFAYAGALLHRGFDEVLQKVSVEPSGEAFNELSLEPVTNRPKNPMINAGAITVHQMIGEPGITVEERVEKARHFFSRLAGRELQIDNQVFESELESAHRNLALAHMLRNYGVLEGEPHDAVRGYTAQCAIQVTAKDLAVMGAALANAGQHPYSRQENMIPHVARQTLSVMAAAGMYDAAGTWLAQVGIPAKSGVSGGLLGALPGHVGLGVFSPRLDEHGNSVRGMKACRKLSHDMGLHLLQTEAFGSATLRTVRERKDDITLELQGIVQFTGAENVLHYLDENTLRSETVTFDLSRVHHFTQTGRRLTIEIMQRLAADGHQVVLDDPEGTLPDVDLGEGNPVERN